MRLNQNLNASHGQFLALTGAALLLALSPGRSAADAAQNAKLSVGGNAVRVPSRPSASLFQGESARSTAQIDYDPSTHRVTVGLSVQDPHGYFIPNIRRDNFAVFENGIRQRNIDVEVTHPSVTLGLLLESGGRYPSLNDTIALAVQNAAEQLVNELRPDDTLRVWRYGDTLESVTDATDSLESLRRAIRTMPTPKVSELNFYDAMLASIKSLEPVTGRKALIVVTSGIDTFSHANFDAVLRAAEDSGVTIYAINLSPVAHGQANLASVPPPYSRLNWTRAQKQLLTLTRASGGRVYSPDSMIDLSSVYDDLTENLRTRYVLTYQSNSDPLEQGLRTVRVALVNPTTGGPLRIVDADNRAVLATVSAEASYRPASNALTGANTQDSAR